jgi:hypothetical protein
MSQRRRIVWKLAFSAVSVLCPSFGRATTATFYGIVQGSTGVPGAVATLTNDETSQALRKTGACNTNESLA